MAVITRARLSRGIKLHRGHVHGPFSAAATQLQGNIEVAQRDRPYGTFRLTFQVPVVGGDALFNAGAAPGMGNHLMIPFTLPPFQEFFSTTGQLGSTVPAVILTEFQLSFDQRGEPCAIRESAVAGDMDFDLAATYDIGVSIKEKTMRAFDSDAPTVPQVEVVGWTFDRSLWTSPDTRQNPVIVPDLNVPFHPYRTYVVYVDARDLNQAAGFLALPSFTISLKFKTPLIPRDVLGSNQNEIANMPLKHGGAQTPAVVTVTQPAEGASPIAAEGASGIQTNAEVIDRVLLTRLDAGYGEFSNLPAAEHLAEDACYEVICVPLFPTEAGVTDANEDRLPYVGAAPYQGATCDRRVIPLAHPLTVHHVVFAQNWATDAAADRPSSAGLVHQVGVAIAYGFRSDDVSYQQVAYATWNETPASRAGFLIDVIKEREAGTMSSPPGVEEDFDMALLHIPLVRGSGVGDPVGASYAVAATGPPVYVGKALFPDCSPRSDISPVALGTLDTPLTLGMEQFIEVRWRFADTVSGLGGAPYPPPTVFVGAGWGGCVYLICKKHTVQPHPLDGAR